MSATLRDVCVGLAELAHPDMRMSALTDPSYTAIWAHCFKVQAYFDFSLNIFNSLPIMNASQYGTSDSFANFSALSNPSDTQNVSCLGLCGRDICPKKLCLIWAGYFQSSVDSIYIINNNNNKPKVSPFGGTSDMEHIMYN